MNSDEYIIFLKSLLIKIENTINLIEQEPPKHIPAYRKMLGVQQKMAELKMPHKSDLFTQFIKVKGIINYLMNGHYEKAYAQILGLKAELVQICLGIKNEKDTIK